MLLGIILCAALSPLIPRTGAGAGAANCSRSCGSATVPYPFGFSAGCGIRLSCNSTNSILVGGYPVWNITPGSLLLDVPPSCDRPVGAAVGALFGPNYAMTWRNGLFLRNCTATAAASRCLIPTSLVAQISRRRDLASCGEKGDNITCYSSGRTDGFLSPDNATASGCGYVFTSVLYTAGAGAQMPALVFGAAELGWWLNGPCRCSANATCTTVAPAGNAATGFTCSCDDGFVGDGFADGDGCVRAAGRCGGASNRKRFDGCGGRGRARVGLLIGGIIAGASLLLGLLLLCSAARRKSVASSEQAKRLLLLSEAASCPVAVYSYKDMERATNAFSDAYKLGTGAYATVYVGKLPEGLVAVKRIRCRDHPSSRSSSALNEIRLISSVRHPNLVRLLGCCVDRGEQILVYEFVPNGTLAQHLRPRGGGERHRGLLPWRARLGIAAEVARAVAYLHTALQPPIYHRDIKSTNILLDGELRPKIADFGLSRAGVGAAAESSHVSTAPQGTPGYLDPQYHQDFQLTDKSDVYSFGVVLVEMLTALKVVDFERAPSEVNLASLAVDRIGRGRLEEILDPLLLLPPLPPAEGEGEGEGEWVMESIRRVAELAFRCLAFHKDVRPCMTEVAEELERIRLSAPPPPPAPAPAPAPAPELEEGEEDVVEVSGLVGSKSEEGKRRRRRSRGMRLGEVARADSPVSVQEVLWVSEQSSSPSTNGSMPRFVKYTNIPGSKEYL